MCDELRPGRSCPIWVRENGMGRGETAEKPRRIRGLTIAVAQMSDRRRTGAELPPYRWAKCQHLPRRYGVGCPKSPARPLVEKRSTLCCGGRPGIEISVLALMGVNLPGAGRPSIRPSVRPTPSVRPPVRPPIRPSVRPFVLRASVLPSVRPSVRPSQCPFVRPSVRLSVRPSARLSVHPSVCQSVRPSIRPSSCPSVRLSVRPSVRPSVRVVLCNSQGKK